MDLHPPSDRPVMPNFLICSRLPQFQLLFFCCFSSCLLSVSPAHSQKAPLHTFTNIQGVKFEGRIKAVAGKKATLELANGRDYTTSIASFSPADQQYINRWGSGNPSASIPAPVKSGIKLEKINQLIGHHLFSDGNLWENPAPLVAGRLRWPKESYTPYSSSYRGYPQGAYRFIGVRPYSVVLYGNDGKVSSLSIVFANKGDFFSAAGSGEKHFIKGKAVTNEASGLKKIMNRDARIISDSLTKLLGQAKRQKFGDGSTRQMVFRWDWSGHSFLLSNVEGEYVSLSIQPVAFADQHGRSKRTPDSIIRKRAQENVEKRSNGDVVIKNIPMVNQGPKSYCVPATAERCMRYLGIPADMYVLAMAGQTKLGVGTSPAILLDAVGRDIKRKGRSFKIWDGKIKIHELTRYIDKGIPVMWGLFSTRDFNRIANARTLARKNPETWDDYKAKTRRTSASTKLPIERNTSHIVIITGYNKASGEIAFSDSWGENFKERWITVSEAQQISQNRFYVVDL